MQGQSAWAREKCTLRVDYTLLKGGRSNAASLLVLEAGDFAHARESAADVRDSDGTADD